MARVKYWDLRAKRPVRPLRKPVPLWTGCPPAPISLFIFKLAHPHRRGNPWHLKARVPPKGAKLSIQAYKLEIIEEFACRKRVGHLSSLSS